MEKKETFRKWFTFDGKRYSARGKTEEEALKKIIEMKLELEKGKVLKESKMTVSDWAIQCIETYKTNQKEVTRTRYLSRIKYCILREIGDMPIDKVTPLKCQQVLNLQNGKSKTQINEVYHALRFIFRKAVENRLINTSPAEYIIRPQGYTNHRRAITEEERKHLVSLFPTDKRFLVFAFMLYCGCRPSEARQLKRNNIILEDGYLLLNVQGSKTHNANRYVPIPQDLQKLIQEEVNTPGFYSLCTNAKGKEMNTADFRRAWEALKREMNISMGCKVYRNQLQPPYPLADDFVPYNLRHTFCTDLQKQGIDIRTAQYLMGHSDITTTANIYTHLDKMDAVKMAANLQTNGGCKKTKSPPTAPISL